MLDKMHIKFPIALKMLAPILLDALGRVVTRSRA